MAAVAADVRTETGVKTGLDGSRSVRSSVINNKINLTLCGEEVMGVKVE